MYIIIDLYQSEYKHVQQYISNLLGTRRDFSPYSAGIDFSRQNLTSVDVRFWRLKSISAL